VPRKSLGVWRTRKTKRSAVDILRKSDPDRLNDLVPIRYGRMLQSPFAFYRGEAAVMAADLGHLATPNLRVQVCGDCHLVNFGGFATPERNVLFDMNDFDETLPAPFDWDVRRLTASIVLAGRSLGFSDKKTRAIAVGCAGSYRENIRRLSEMDPLDRWYARITSDDFIDASPRKDRRRLRKRIDKARSSHGSHLAFPKMAESSGGTIRIKDQPPLIFHPDFSEVPEFDSTLKAVFAEYRKTLPDDRRILLDSYHVVDAALKVVGIGSVGRRCWIALLMSEENTPLFLQFKEAVASVLEPYAGKSGYAHHGQRVVMGQRLMQPASDIFLGWLTAPNGRQFYVRQLRDAKIKPIVETFNTETLEAYARGCGWVLARAHAKASEASAAIAEYLGSSDEFDEAMADFGVAYADQTERDHAELKTAVRNGKITVVEGH
jgi:uncharacterized protein (DUF2252 family)